MNLPLRLTNLIELILLIVVTWLLIHLMSVVGLFIGIIYPFLWLLVPNKTVCLLCHAKKDGSHCPFCRQRINKTKYMAPQNFISAIENGALLLALTLVSMGIVYSEQRLLSSRGLLPPAKTVTFTIPAKGQYHLGEVIPMKIEINNIKTPINVVQADLQFDPEKLAVESISTEESFASIFVQKDINNTAGYVRLTGGLPNPGFSGNQGIFGTVIFRAKTAGIATIKYLPSSLVLANDGKGTNILKDLTTVSYVVLPEKITIQEATQPSVTSTSSVLGVSKTTETQMTFYEEEPDLSAITLTQPSKPHRRVVTENLLHGIGILDRASLQLWQRLFPFMNLAI